MLPSRGFFKKNDCPFFEKGLCVRPHCHFRHKKKVISENSSSADSQDDFILPESPDGIALVKGIKTEDTSVSTTCTSSNKAEYSSNDLVVQKEESSQDSLFAKLVNQSNPYEKISRHIPCAYTPTPQIRGVQPKNKTVNLRNSANVSKDDITKTKTIYGGYKTVSNKQSENRFVTSQTLDSCNSSILNRTASNENSVSLVNSINNKFSSKNSECEIPFFDNSISDCYEPQSTRKFVNSNGQESKTYNFSSDYVPSKVTATETQYIPNSNDESSSLSYVPSKEKPKRSQYVPESTGNVKNEITYKPSDKTGTRETQYQPESSTYVADYVPTEKSATKTSSSSWLASDKNELSNIEFISSEIELMKELLKDEISEKKLETDESTPKTESICNKSKNEKQHKEKHRSARSHHSSSSNSRSQSSSHSHSGSSKSKSSSSRHHSTSKSHSDRHRSSRDKDKKSRSIHSHEKSKHHSSRKKDKSKSQEGRKSEDDGNKVKQTAGKKKKHESSDDAVDGLASDLGDSSGGEGNSEMENEYGVKKRKYGWENENQHFKLFKKDSEDLFEELEEDPDTVEKQCLEIFNSYSSTVNTSAAKKTNEISLPPEEYESTVQAKKRTAHSSTITSDHSVLRHKTAKTVRTSIKSAQEVMLERYKAVEKTKESKVPQPPPPQPAPILGLSRPFIKIAAVSNIQQMLQAKKAIQEKINQGIKVNERTTIAQTAPHGSSRVAHTPAAKEMKEAPTVNCGSKQVPRIKRQIYLDKLLLETNQIYPTKGESAEEALKLEEEVFRANSGSLSAYHAAFVSLLLKTRRRVAAVKGETSKCNAPRSKMSHSDVLSGGKKNFSVIKTKRVDISMLTDRHIYEELLRCKLTPEELKENEYPMESDRPGYATCSLNFELKYNAKYLHIKKMTGNRRYCIRCSKQYDVDPFTWKQFKEGPGTCCYHPGKKKSGGRHLDRIYNCCNSASSEGCTTHIRHVTDCNDYEKFPNCVKTLTKENEINPGIFALDCEMVYTRLGVELARVTVVNLKKEIVYDTLVKPNHPIECFNTLYSGIEEKMMEGVETTLKDVQAVLLSMFSDKTILIGHSLDSDLRALHLIHDTVVDTAVVYKNEKYHPYKYSLKDLCAKKISKIIQSNVNFALVSGHDSAEDAIAALEIMLNHVKEEVSKYESLDSYEADRTK